VPLAALLLRPVVPLLLVLDLAVLLLLLVLLLWFCRSATCFLRLEGVVFSMKIQP
jgi:hypothetical protein